MKYLITLGLLITSQAYAGLTFSVTFDPNVSAQAQATINSTLAIYQALFVDPITVNLKFQDTNVGLGSSSTFSVLFSYASVRNRMLADGTTADDATANATLTAPGVGGASPIPGGATQIAVTTANARALGLCACTQTFDGTISLNLSLMNLSRSGPQDPSKYDLMAVVMHEVNEVLGTISGLPSSQPLAMDLFRYDGNGNRSFTSNTAATSYFSVNGTTQLAQYNQSGSGDFGDFISGGPLHVQNAFATPGAQPDLDVELRMLDVVGYNFVATPEPTTISMLGAGLIALALAKRLRA